MAHNHNLIFGVLIIIRYVSEVVWYITASVYGVSQHVQLLEHSLICDVPSHCLVNNDLCSEQDPPETVLHAQHLQLGTFVDEEIYVSSEHFTKYCRKEYFHLDDHTAGGENDQVGCGMAWDVSRVRSARRANNVFRTTPSCSRCRSQSSLIVHAYVVWEFDLRTYLSLCLFYCLNSHMLFNQIIYLLAFLTVGHCVRHQNK